MADVSFELFGFKATVNYDLVRAGTQCLFFRIRLQSRTKIIFFSSGAQSVSVYVEKSHADPRQYAEIADYSFRFFNVIPNVHTTTSVSYFNTKGKKVQYFDTIIYCIFLAMMYNYFIK